MGIRRVQKRCTGNCKQMRPLSDYYANAKAKDGLCWWCRHCWIDYLRNYKKHGIRIRIEPNKTDDPLYQKWGRFRRLYNITKDHYDKMISDQDGFCFVCGRREPVVIYQDRFSKIIKGVICRKCSKRISIKRKLDEREV